VNKIGFQLLSWASEIDDATVKQARMAAKLPFIAGHVALMPDAHLGKGATVGSVTPTEGAIIPAAVGVDIGCGMVAVETSLDAAALPDDLGSLLGRIDQVVPAGVGQGHDVAQVLPGGKADWLTQKQYATACNQLGTLGSGNHFIEVCLDERDVVWVVLHSGSRGVGNQLAQRYIEAAKGLMKQYFIKLDDQDLAYLVEGTPEFEAYITAMLWAQDYALSNRSLTMDAVLAELFAQAPGSELRRINCHHNFTQREHHHGRNVWLTRKGAIKAGVNDFGVIPGSMGTKSYIVKGKGSPASYESCSHGAGRRLSRSAARRTYQAADLALAMEGKTWLADRAEALLDEIPASYKDIDQVMADQQDLVEVQHTLRQVLNFKGA
jgi:tRNA-splicing ligase RtcB